MQPKVCAVIVMSMGNMAVEFGNTTRQIQTGIKTQETTGIFTIINTATPSVATSVASVLHPCMQCKDTTLYCEFIVRNDQTFCSQHPHVCPLSCRWCQPCSTKDEHQTSEEKETLGTGDDGSMFLTTRDWPKSTTILPANRNNIINSVTNFNPTNFTASSQVLEVMTKLDELFKGKRCNDTAGTTNSLVVAGCTTLSCQYSSDGFMYEVSQPDALGTTVSGIVKAYGYTPTNFTKAVQQIWINYTQALLPWVQNMSIQVIIPNATFAPANLSAVQKGISQSVDSLANENVFTSKGPNITAPSKQVDTLQNNQTTVQKHIQNEGRRILTVNMTFASRPVVQEEIPQSINLLASESFVASKGQSSLVQSIPVDTMHLQYSRMLTQENTRPRAVHFKLRAYVLLTRSKGATTSSFPTIDNLTDVDNFTDVPDAEPFTTTTNIDMDGTPFSVLQFLEEIVEFVGKAERESNVPVFFGIMMIIALICFVVLFVSSGCGLGCVISGIINRFYLRGSGRLVIRRLKFAILSGKVFFSGVTFTSKNRVVTVHRGAIQFHLFKLKFVDKRPNLNKMNVKSNQASSQEKAEAAQTFAGAGKVSEHDLQSTEKFRLTAKLYCVQVVLLNNSGKYDGIDAVKKRAKANVSTQKPNTRSALFHIVPAVSWEIYHGCVYAATSRHHLMWAAHFRRAEGVVYDLDCPPETRDVDLYRVMSRTVFEKARILLLRFNGAALLEPNSEIISKLSRGLGHGMKARAAEDDHTARDRVNAEIRSGSPGSTAAPKWDQSMTEEEMKMAINNSPRWEVFFDFLSQDPKNFEELSNEEKQQLLMQFQAGFVDTGEDRRNILLEERVRKMRALFSNSVQAAGTGLHILREQTEKAAKTLGLRRKMQVEDNEELNTDQQDRTHLKKDNDTNKNEVLVVDRIDVKYFYDVPGVVTSASAEMAYPPQTKLYIDLNREKLSKTTIAYGPHCERFRKLFIRHFYPTNYGDETPWYQPQVGDLRTIEEWTMRLSLFGATEFTVPYSSIDPAVVAAAAKVNPTLGAAVKKASEDAREQQAREWLTLEFEEDAGEADDARVPRLEVQYPYVRRRSGSESIYSVELCRVKMYSITNTRHSRFYAPFPATSPPPTSAASTLATPGPPGQHQRAPSSASTLDREDMPTTGTDTKAPQNLGGFRGGRGAPLLVTPTLTIEYKSQMNRKWNAVYKCTTTIVLHKPTIQVLRPQIADLTDLLSEWSNTSDAVQQLLFTPSRYAFMLTAHDAEIVMSSNANNVCDLPFHPDYNNLLAFKVPLVEVEVQTPRDRFQPRYSQV